MPASVSASRGIHAQAKEMFASSCSTFHCDQIPRLENFQTLAQFGDFGPGHEADRLINLHDGVPRA